MLSRVIKFVKSVIDSVVGFFKPAHPVQEKLEEAQGAAAEVLSNVSDEVLEEVAGAGMDKAISYLETLAGFRFIYSLCLIPDEVHFKTVESLMVADELDYEGCTEDSMTHILKADDYTIGHCYEKYVAEELRTKENLELLGSQIRIAITRTLNK